MTPLSSKSLTQMVKSVVYKLRSSFRRGLPEANIRFIIIISPSSRSRPRRARLGQIGDLVELDGQIGQQDELRDALARADGARLLRVVVEGDKALAAVVAVHNADAVAGRSPSRLASPLRANTPPKVPSGSATAMPVGTITVWCAGMVTSPSPLRQA